MRILLGLVALIGTACAPPRAVEWSVAEQTAQQDSIRGIMTTMAQEISAQGFVAWLPYLHRTEHFVWSADGALEFPSADSLDTFIRGFAATLTHTELEFTAQRVSPLRPGVAQVAASYRELFVGTKADTTRVAGMFIGVWVHTPDGWRLASGHTSHPAAPH